MSKRERPLEWEAWIPGPRVRFARSDGGIRSRSQATTAGLGRAVGACLPDTVRRLLLEIGWQGTELLFHFAGASQGTRDKRLLDIHLPPTTPKDAEIMRTVNLMKNSPRPMSQDDPIVPIAQRKTMTTLLPDDCRWPIGDPQLAGFHFCGKRKQDGHPYCEFHVRRARTPSRARGTTYRLHDAV